MHKERSIRVSYREVRKNLSVMGFWKKEQVAEASTSKESGKPSTLVMSSSGETEVKFVN